MRSAGSLRTSTRIRTVGSDELATVGAMLRIGWSQLRGRMSVGRASIIFEIGAPLIVDHAFSQALNVRDAPAA